MRFLLSIHDVWPGNASLVSEYLGRLRSLGARKVALLVVPAYHGSPPMDGQDDFLAWLRKESAAGTELFLHGYRHCTAESLDCAAESPLGAAIPARAGRNAYGRWVNRVLVGQEAEFCGLDAPAGERLLDMGVASFARAGLPLAGFVAPTWHGSPSPVSLRVRGLGILETRFSVMRLGDGAVRRALPLTWTSASAGGNPALYGGRVGLRVLLNTPLLKVAVHPGDMRAPGTEKVLERVFSRGTNIGYGEAFGEPSTDPVAYPSRKFPGLAEDRSPRK